LREVENFLFPEKSKEFRLVRMSWAASLLPRKRQGTLW